MSPPNVLLSPGLAPALPVPGRPPASLPPGLLPVDMPADTYVFLLRDTILRLREAEATITAQQERIDALEAQALTDELTGLLNRRGLLDTFRRELAGARRSGLGGVLVMVDLDGFKAINDTNGHQCGDHYLRQVAKVLAENVRAEDVVARLGGDEFVVLLTRTPEEAGLHRAQLLADSFNARTCRWGMQDLPLRASFGIQAYGPKDKEDDILRKADMGMYATKAKRKAAR